MKANSKRREYVDSIEQLKEDHQVLRIGKLNAEHVKAVVELSDDNLDVVLTQPRWAYIQSKQDGRDKLAKEAVAAIQDPDEVHRDRHSENAVFYKRLSKLFIKVVVWLQPKKTDKQHSVGDWYLKREKQVRRDDENVIWGKEKRPSGGAE